MLGLKNKDNQPVPGPASTTKRPSKRLTLGLVILIVVLVGGGAYLYHQHKHSGIPAAPTENQTYSATTLTAHTLSGAVSGTAMSFELPKPFIARPNPQGKSAARLQIYSEYSSGKVPIAIAGALAGSYAYPKGQTPSKSFLKEYNANLTAAKQSVIDGQEKLALATLKGGYLAHKQLSIQSLKNFTNADIKQGAWVADFTAASGSKSLPSYKGRLVKVITNKATYTFYVFAYDYNWDANQNTWTQVFDSLKVDQ